MSRTVNPASEHEQAIEKLRELETLLQEVSHVVGDVVIRGDMQPRAGMDRVEGMLRPMFTRLRGALTLLGEGS